MVNACCGGQGKICAGELRKHNVGWGRENGKKRKSKETKENENGRKGGERKRFIDLA